MSVWGVARIWFVQGGVLGRNADQSDPWAHHDFTLPLRSSNDDNFMSCCSQQPRKIFHIASNPSGDILGYFRRENPNSHALAATPLYCLAYRKTRRTNRRIR